LAGGLSADFSGAADSLRDLAGRLERVGGPGLDAKLQAALNELAPGLVRAAKDSARDTLPSRGGLNARVARSDITFRVIRSSSRSGIRFTVQRNAVRDPASINRGRVRHPTYGHRPYPIQLVKPGWFSIPMKAARPKVRVAITGAIRRHLREA
jgi:hypothetical protein